MEFEIRITMNHKIHLAIQIVPLSDKHPYPIIDKAIEVIANSGIRYEVGPMETVLEGTYDEVMQVVKKTQEVCFAAGANELLVNIKLHLRKHADVTWEEKMEKYR